MHTSVPSRSGQPVSRDTFAQLLRAEFNTFRTVRSWMLLLSAVVISLVLLPFVVAEASHGTAPVMPIGPGGEAVTDTYMFVHQPLVGNGTLTTSITSFSGRYTPLSNDSSNGFGTSSKTQLGSELQPGLAPWAKAGILLEPDTKQGTAYAAVLVTGAHGVQMQDNYTHARAGLPGSVGPASPRWLRLTRVGDVITGDDSADGTHWTTIGTTRLAGLPQTVQIGLFVTSPLYFPTGSNEGTPSIATATFDHTTTQGDVALQAWTGDAIGGFYPDLQSDALWQQPSADAFTISGSGDIAPLVGGIVSNNWSGACIVDGIIVGLLILILLAASFVTAEERREPLHTISVGGPRRALAAKTVVLGSLSFAAGTIATALAEVLTRHVLAANGISLFPQSALATAQVIFGTGLFLGLAAILVVALGSILRRRSLAVVVGLVLLIVPGVIATLLPADLESWLMRLTPTAAFATLATLPQSTLVTDAYTIMNGYFPISPGGGLAVLAAYTVVALGGAMWLLPRHRVPSWSSKTKRDRCWPIRRQRSCWHTRRVRSGV
jgi:hypothetical protein